MRPRTLHRVLAACGVAVLGGVLQAHDAAALAPGTWGPEHTPYLDGVVCSTPTGRTALVSWPGPGGSPAFATSAISGPPAGRPGPTDAPAVGGTSRAVSPADSTLSESEIGTLAYLIGTHGRDASPAVGDVAAAVIDQIASDADVTSCLDQRQGGTAPETAGGLLAEAAAKAGPYHVAVSAPAVGRVTAGKTAEVTAEVTGSAGRPVAGLQVTFGSADPAATLSTPNGVTDSTGRTSTTVTVGRSAPSQMARVTASVTAVTGLIETRAPSAASLFSAAGPSTFRGLVDLAVDTVPDPHLGLAAGSRLLLAGDPLLSTLTVTGMNGHSGVATVSTYGPLKVVPRTGCSGHTSAEWAAARAAHRAASSAQLVVRGDGTLTVAPTSGLDAGCYQLGASITITDATPNLTRSAAGPIAAAVPLSVRLVPSTSSLQPVGPLTAQVQVTSSYANSVRSVRGELLGPRRPERGRCPSTGWDAAGPSRATVSSTPVDSTHVRVVSSAVPSAGCYAFRVDAEVALPELGTIGIRLTPGADDPAVLALAPGVAVTDLSSTGITTGRRARATVQVVSTEDQKGALTLELRHLPYTYRGCFGADWTHAEVVSSSTAPVTATAGDNAYRVSSAAVPTTGCWTVVPVFRAASNPKVVATGTPGTDPMLAFTGLDRVRSAPVAAVSHRASDDRYRMGITGVLLGAALLVTVTSSLSLAGRERVPAFDPLATLHL